MSYDGYKEFYRDFYKKSKGDESVSVPKDYKETILYILGETGLNVQQVEAVSRYFGIGAFEDNTMQETNTLIGTGAKMNLSGAGVLQKITHLMYQCWITPRRRVLEMGIGNYKEMYGSIFGVSDEIKQFQEECGRLDNEYEILLKQAEMKKKQRDKRMEEFAKAHEIDCSIARRIACRCPENLSLPEIEAIFEGGIIERWCR